MKTRIILSILILAMAVVCPVMAEEITIVGTGSGSSILKAIGADFSKANPDIIINVPKSIGSGGGIKAVGMDKNIIGRVARELKKKESSYGLTYAPFAKMPIIIMTNKNVKLKNLSPEQVCGIYAGIITNWKEVGGQDARIRVIRREDGDSSLAVLLDTFPGFSKITLTTKSKTTHSDPLTIKLCESKKDTIAFGTYPNAKISNVNVLAINGKAPSDQDYPYVGTLALVFKEANKKGNIAKFVGFALSGSASEAIIKTGGLPAK